MLVGRSMLVMAVAAMPALAQSIPGAVLARNEPHHHLAFEDATLRVLRVSVPAHDTTLLHEHDPDYFWIALGASEVVNAKLGAPDAVIKSADLSIHYTPGNFAHVARNPGDIVFDNITVELLGAQTNVRNLCEPALGGAPMSCDADSVTRSGVTEHPAFETDQQRVSLMTIAPRSAVAGTQRGPRTWIIALHQVDAERVLRAETPSAGSAGTQWRGGVWRSPVVGQWFVTNVGPAPVKVLRVTQR